MRPGKVFKEMIGAAICLAAGGLTLGWRIPAEVVSPLCASIRLAMAPARPAGVGTISPIPLSRYLNEKTWDALFPHRCRLDSGGRDFYSFRAFKAAAEKFPEFLSEKDAVLQKRELAAFLANIAQETSGGWAQAPGGYFAWGLYFARENAGKGSPNAYADNSKPAYPPVPGRLYYGRGPAQISWNYNYGQFSQAWFGNKQTLLDDPDRVATDPVLSFASAIWFWMTAQFPKPSCHSILSGEWVPTADDRAKGRAPGFGATVNVINGGVECGTGRDMQKTVYRYRYYRYFCAYLHVSPGENIECTDQRAFGK
jgi:hypothetical protein